MNPSMDIKWQCLVLAVQALDSQRFGRGEDRSTAIMDLAEKMASWTSTPAASKLASISVISNGSNAHN